MDKQELIEKYELELKDVQLKFGSSLKTKVFEEVLRDLKQLDEPQKPVVKQFVADWYEKHKNNIDFGIWHYLHSFSSQKEDEFKKWMNKSGEKQIQTLVNMHQFGYEVEKEKRYRVKAKGVGFNSCLIFEKINKTWFFSSIYETDHQRGNHTRKELEEAGFGEVFNSPLFEVEEVE